MQLILDADGNTIVSSKMSNIVQEQLSYIVDKDILDEKKEVNKSIVNGNKENIKEIEDNNLVNNKVEDVIQDPNRKISTAVQESIKQQVLVEQELYERQSNDNNTTTKSDDINHLNKVDCQVNNDEDSNLNSDILSHTMGDTIPSTHFNESKISSIQENEQDSENSNTMVEVSSPDVNTETNAVVNTSTKEEEGLINNLGNQNIEFEDSLDKCEYSTDLNGSIEQKMNDIFGPEHKITEVNKLEENGTFEQSEVNIQLEVNQQHPKCSLGIQEQTTKILESALNSPDVTEDEKTIAVLTEEENSAKAMHCLNHDVNVTAAINDSLAEDVCEAVGGNSLDSGNTKVLTDVVIGLVEVDEQENPQIIQAEEESTDCLQVSSSHTSTISINDKECDETKDICHADTDNFEFPTADMISNVSESKEIEDNKESILENVCQSPNPSVILAPINETDTKRESTLQSPNSSNIFTTDTDNCDQNIIATDTDADLDIENNANGSKDKEISDAMEIDVNDKEADNEQMVTCNNNEKEQTRSAVILVENSQEFSTAVCEKQSSNSITEVFLNNTVEHGDDQPEIEMDGIIDSDQVKETEEAVINLLEEGEKRIETSLIKEPDNVSKENFVEQKRPSLCNLSNNLDILSDDDDEHAKEDESETAIPTEKQCINIDDDDDIMLIDEDNDNKGVELEQTPSTYQADDIVVDNTKLEQSQSKSMIEDIKISDNHSSEDKTLSDIITEVTDEPPDTDAKPLENCTVIEKKPLLPLDFLKSCKKNLADMTRTELEEFCILKIVESVVDRSSLSDIKSKLKSLTNSVEEYKKKAVALTKQNRDLQVVLKSVQEEQRKTKGLTPISPLKITRSVGMQILMTEPGSRRKQGSINTLPNNTMNNKQVRNGVNQSTRTQKQPANTQQIPVPRLIPANNSTAKAAANAQINSNNNRKTKSPSPNGVKNIVPNKTAEKRNRLQSVTVDLTDDEPPAKVPTRLSAVPPVRLVSPQSLLATRPPLPQTNSNSPRKVYIPISGPQGQNVRPGQIMLKAFSATSGPRPRLSIPSNMTRAQNATRLAHLGPMRHPAPLPDAIKQYQPPNWKALPPAPDLKLSKVENGIVISWKIEGYQEDSYEEIASYQLYAYQETSTPPNTNLWKKIGDVKALPLPMACTLTQFMAGYKYYFAVRAVDIRSRLGRFSLPGSILLLSKT